jgi:hypothetical protein
VWRRLRFRRWWEFLLEEFADDDDDPDVPLLGLLLCKRPWRSPFDWLDE